MTDFRATQFEQAALEGVTATGIYNHAQPAGQTLNPESAAQIVRNYSKESR
jgi:hypothetical protein